MIRDSLKDKRILLTGATGFLGSAILERLLADVDVGRIDVAIRGDAESRLKWLLSGSVFGPLRTRLGSGFDDLVAGKVTPISADLSAQPQLPTDVDLVIHSAATVSFDPPIQEAFAVNLSGSLAVLGAVPDVPFLHVSTAYVAGVTRGTQPERLLVRDVDWRAEAQAAERLAGDIEAESRRPEVLARLTNKARSEVGKAGPQTVARRAEELRRDWVQRRQVGAGRDRARSLGWPDVYTFTKAMTERALDELAGDRALAIVRPSIIESALTHPYPGWIEGFRMADPVMLGYGRGALPDFPGIPEGVLDVIPVDMVVNCVLAVATRLVTEPPEGSTERGERAVFHISSGSRNPLTFRGVYENTREYFVREPLPERGRGAYRVPEWSFPGRRAVERKISTAEKMLERADRVLGKLPRTEASREAARKVDRLRRRFDFVKKYADLYGPYVEAEVIYTDDRSRQLFGSLPEEDQRDFGFDPTTFTWEHYIQQVHLPLLTAPLRWPGQATSGPEVRITPAGSGGAKVIAAFDIEGTLVDSNVVETYIWLRLSEMEDVAERTAFLAQCSRKAPGWLKAESRDRGEFLRMFYRQYAGADAEAVRSLAAKTMGDLMLRKLSPQAVRRIREHRRAGHLVIFITGSLDFIVDPLAPLADHLVTVHLEERGGYFTGDLQRPPLVGEARAGWLRDYAEQVGADLSSSYSYADSMSDLPLLEAVGNPVAVNPDVSLSRYARRMRWPIERWDPESGPLRYQLPQAQINRELEGVTV